MTISWRGWPQARRLGTDAAEAHAKDMAQDVRNRIGAEKNPLAFVVDGDTIIVAKRGPSDLVVVYEARVVAVGEESPTYSATPVPPPELAAIDAMALKTERDAYKRRADIAEADVRHVRADLAKLLGGLGTK